MTPQNETAQHGTAQNGTAQNGTAQHGTAQTLRGKVAVVTGAGQGIGLGIARALATDGADVAVLGRTAATLEQACEQLRDIGVTAEPFLCDVATATDVPEVLERVVEVFGGVDILVNNAYTGAHGPLLSMTGQEFQSGFHSGPFATFAFMKACHPYMKGRGGGSIINLVTSAMVRWDPSNYGAYAAAKVAIRSLTRTAAAEWGRDGIRVNAVAPLGTSPALAGWTEANPDEAAQFLGTVPLGYIGDCEQDIGRAVVQIVGPDTRYLTGATIPLDGGQGHF